MNKMNDSTLTVAGTARGYFVTQGDSTIANFSSSGALSLFISGASAAKLSVYDADAKRYICGTVDELMEGERLQD